MTKKKLTEKQIEVRMNSIVIAREVKKSSINVQECELDGSIEPHLPFGAFMDFDKDQESSVLQPSLQRLSSTQRPLQSAPKLSEPSNAASVKPVHPSKELSFATLTKIGRPLAPLAELSDKQLCRRLVKQGLSPKIVAVSDLEKVTDWRSFLASWKVFVGETKKRRKVIVLDDGLDDEEVEGIDAAAEGVVDSSAAAVRTADQTNVEVVDAAMMAASGPSNSSLNRKFASVDAALEVGRSLAAVPGCKRLAMLVVCGAVFSSSFLNKSQVSRFLRVSLNTFRSFQCDFLNVGLLSWLTLLARKPRTTNPSKLQAAVRAKLQEVCYQSSSLTRAEPRSLHRATARNAARSSAAKAVNASSNASYGSGIKPKIRRPSHAVQYLPAALLETYKVYFTKICSKSYFHNFLKQRPWFKPAELRSCLCDICNNMFFVHLHFLCEEVENLVLTLEELPQEFCARFCAFSNSNDAKTVSRIFRQQLTKWTGHLYALPACRCEDADCSSHCPNFMLGCNCIVVHEKNSCEVCALGFDLLDLFGLLISHLASSNSSTRILPFSSSTYMEKLVQMKEDFCFYVAHRWRSKVQRNVLPLYRANLGQFEAVVLIDYKMKILPVRRNEVQSLFFGQCGISLMGAVVYFRLGDDTVHKLHYYCIGGQDCAQDAELTSFILAALLECLARKSIKKLHLLSDGARTFQSMEFLNRVHTLNNYNRTLGLHGIQIVDCSFTEAGEGKSELDGSFAVISRLVREYALAVGQVTTPVELRKCLQVKLQGSEKHILLHLRQKNFYENLYKTHTSFADNPLQLYDEDVGSYIFNSAESFTRYKRWVLHENYAVLQTASHADLSLASFWQRSSKGWLHVPNPPSPIEKPTTPQRPVRAAASFKRSPSLPPSNAPTSTSSLTTDSPIPSSQFTQPESSSLQSPNSLRTFRPNRVPQVPRSNLSSGSSTFAVSAQPVVLPTFSPTTVQPVGIKNPFFFGMAMKYPKVKRARLPEDQRQFLLNYLMKGKKKEPSEIRVLLSKKFPNAKKIMTVEQIKPFLRNSKKAMISAASTPISNVKKSKKHS